MKEDLRNYIHNIISKKVKQNSAWHRLVMVEKLTMATVKTDRHTEVNYNKTDRDDRSRKKKNQVAVSLALSRTFAVILPANTQHARQP